jgi:glycine/D-amino acid oxidase-like deaminating enzyme
VVEQFVAEGGEYRQAAVAAHDLDSGQWKALPLTDVSSGDSAGGTSRGTSLVADRYVFACGPWLGKLFPGTVGPHFVSTKQDVFFFGTPAGDPRYNEGNVPVWGDHSEHFMYGIPDNQGRGFKMANDTRGPEFDPTSGQRLVSEDRLAEARRYLAYRFPGMKDAPPSTITSSSTGIRRTRMCGSSAAAQGTDSSMAPRSARWWQASC